LDPGTNPGLSSHPPEQSGARLVHHYELSVRVVHAQLIEGRVFRLCDGPSRRLDPFHCYRSFLSRFVFERGCVAFLSLSPLLSAPFVLFACPAGL